MSTTAQESAADVRNNLDPQQVDALSDQLHALMCTPLSGEKLWPENHRDADRSKARFLLIGLRDARWPLASADEIAETDLFSGGSLIEQDVIGKVDAGAQLLYALYCHPRAKDLLTGEFASPGLLKAYGAASAAYGVSR